MTAQDTPDYQSLVKTSLLEIRKLKARIAELEQPRGGGDIAVVGMACRFPQGGTPALATGIDSYWQLLADGADAVVEAPEARLDKRRFYSDDPQAPGKIVSVRGGYLQDIDEFAADFFFVSPREAESLDPQQRLLLENHWRALEDAGIVPSSLMGSATGLFVGICGNDYYHLLASRAYEQIDTYMASGTAHSTAAGRLAYYLGTQGPAVAVDTACSSSLTAVHLACRSLRQQECSLALVSGVNALLSPEYSINFSRAGMLSPQGRCQTFDDGADGYVRGEGCGVVVLKRLTDALQQNDTVLAVIKGSATNQDGRSSGLTAPNGSAQRQVIAQALADAGVRSEQVGYVEAHGTGTRLGDPIELEALQAAYGRGRREPLAIGSVKSNIGHLEGAAGIAGLIKTVLMLRHGRIPKQLHFHTPNRHVDWESMALQINREMAAWPAEEDRPRLAGVSSFGFGGSNAHVIVGEAPAKPSAARSEPPPGLLTVAARNAEELQRLKQSYHAYLQAHPQTDPADFCYAVNTTREAFQRRLARPCGTLDELLAILASPLDGVDSQRRSMAFLFTGQGAFDGALPRFEHTCPALAERLAAYAGDFERCVGISLDALLFTEAGAEQLQNTGYAQPALFCLQYALAEIWQRWGVQADYLLGHSIGEYAAACLAGVFGFSDALRLVAARGRLMQTACAPGAMLAVLTDAESVAQALKASGADLCIAAYNGRRHTVVSGASATAAEFKVYLDGLGLSYVELKVERAFHSPLMTAMLAEFKTVAGSIEYHPPQKAIVSTRSGALIGHEIAAADYWLAQIVEPVRFTQALETLQQLGVGLGIEMGPKNVLSKLVARDYEAGVIRAVPSLQAQDDSALGCALAAVYEAGVDIDWQGYYGEFRGRPLKLPEYPWTRGKYWYAPAPRQAESPAQAIHPLLQRRVELAGDSGKVVYLGRMTADEPGFNQDHRLRDQVLIPAALYLEMAIAAFGGRPCRIDRVRYPAPLLIEPAQAIELQLTLTESADGCLCRIHARAEGTDTPWSCHFEAYVNDQQVQQAAVTPGEQGEPLEIGEFYRKLERRGVRFGEAYRLLDAIVSDGERWARADVLAVETQPGYLLYPPQLDACFQLIGALLPAAEDKTVLQSGLDCFHFYQPFAGDALRCYATMRPAGEDLDWSFDLTVSTADGECLAQIDGIQLTATDPSSAAGGWLYSPQWQAARLNVDPLSAAEVGRWLAQADRQSERFWQDRQQHRDDLQDVLHNRALNDVMLALTQLGWPFATGQSLSLDECLARLRILPRYRLLLNRCLTELADAGYLAVEPDGWRVVKPLATVDAESAAGPSDAIELQLLEQCGQALVGVLTGDTDFLPLLFPQDDAVSAAALYRDAEGFKALNASAVHVLEDWLATRGQGHLSILEIGAGTGGTTRAVLPLLSAQTEIDYVFTDLSAGFFSRAQTLLSGYDGIRYRSLDIGSDPKAQGFAEREFDLVIAANVIHATADLTRTMAHIAGLLKPSGLLMMLEGLQPKLWVDLIFGLTDGWWGFTDRRVQTGYPLLNAADWRHTLKSSGFGETAVITPQLAATERLCRQSIILSQPQISRDHWLIFADRQGLARQTADYLRQQGQVCTWVETGERFARTGEYAYTVDPEQAEDFDSLLAEWLETSSGAPRSVLHGWAADIETATDADGDTVGRQTERLCAGGLYLLQALGRRQASLQTLTCLSRHAQAVLPNDSVQPVAAAFWGMLRVAMQEYPRFNIRLLDLDQQAAAEANLFRIVTQPAATENPAAVRMGELFVPRLLPLEAAIPTKPIKADAAYLVTGAFGGMGFKLCQWLADQGAQRLILVARRAPSEAVESWLQQCRQNGVLIEVVAADVSDYQSLRSALVEAREIAGVFHCAGSFADRLLQDYDWPVFSRVFPAKVQGSWNLHRLSVELGLDLDHFVMFSSSASLLAVAGLANYVAANSFIDALAAYRKRLDLPALSINWGVWADTGMAAAVSETRQQQWAVMGVQAMQPEAALQAMQIALGAAQAQVGIMDIEFDKMAAGQNAGVYADYFEHVLQPAAETAQDTGATSGSVRQRLQNDPDQLQTYVSETVAAVLGLPDEVDPRRGFFELGMDSLTSMELRNRLQRELDCTLDATLTFKYPSVTALTSYLVQLLISTTESDADQSSQSSVGEEKGGENLSLDEQLADIDRLLAEDKL